ncbi:MAG: MarR family transcriptional regulator [Clostridia bacterium]|nr:MarR family transcriptional regulator [Clostridia bacterium]
MEHSEHNLKIKKLAEISRQTDRLHRKLFEKHAVEAFGIHRSQHMMLMYISRNENASQRQIAEAFNVSAAAVAVTLKKLESVGFINRISSKDDSRRNHISISSKGMDVIERTKHIFGAIDRLMFKDFSDEEIEQLRALTQRMCDNLIEAEKVTTEQLKEGF